MKFVILNKDHSVIRHGISIEKIDAPDEQAAWGYVEAYQPSDTQSWLFDEEGWDDFKKFIANDQEPFPNGGYLR